MVRIKVFGIPMYLKQLTAPRFNKAVTLMSLLPWDKAREHLAGLRPAQTKAIENFTKAGEATAGLALSDRMEIIGKALRGKDYGGVKRVIYPKLAPAQLKAKIAEVQRILA